MATKEKDRGKHDQIIEAAVKTDRLETDLLLEIEAMAPQSMETITLRAYQLIPATIAFRPA